tara:strand:+ start:5357 stop:5686 length:330 start_codon:yes stop_codon:yes gene_type:complete
MSETSDERPMTLLLQVEPYGNWNLDIRNEIMDEAASAGFQWIDATGSRCLFEDGDEELLQQIATRVAQRHDTTASIERMRDPGLGLILARDIDAMDKEMFSVNVTDSEE